MKYKRLLGVIAATGAAAMMQTVQAQVSSTLADLVASGGTLTIGDKTFSNFGYLATGDATELNADAAALTVKVSIQNGIYVLDWGGTIGVDNLHGSSDLIGDLKLTYTVTANPGPITMIDQNYTVNALPGSGQIIIGETVKTPSLVTVGNSTLTLNPLDLSDPLAEAGDNLNIVPGQPQLLVVKDILITAFAGDQVAMSDVEQSFHQVPESSTVVAGTLLLILPLGASALRILRRKEGAV